MNAPFVFFTGGTALRGLATEMAQQNEPAAHLVTIFDSGGSSAELRKAFDMPAVGDIRNRVLAMAPKSPATNLLAHRLDSRMPEAVMEFLAVATGYHPLWQALPKRLHRRLLSILEPLAMDMPRTFDFRGASVGNLVLTALYLRSGRNLTQATHAFTRLIRTVGVVRPVAEFPAQQATPQLTVRLADGREVVGQHSFASKRKPLDLGSPIVDVRLSDVCGRPAQVPMAPVARRLLGLAGLICYPVGSFFSSVAASMLPVGIAAAVARSKAPKVYMPNPGFDPELEGVGVAEQLLHLRRLASPAGLTHILLGERDPRRDEFVNATSNAISNTGFVYPVQVVTANMVDKDERIIPHATLEALRKIRLQYIFTP